MAPVLAPVPLTALPVHPADTRLPGNDPLAQALRDHDERPGADAAAQVLRCIDAAADPQRRQGGEPIDLQALLAGLEPADALVVQVRQGEEVLACVLRAHGVQVFRRLARWSDVHAAWRLVSFQLDARRLGAAALPAQEAQLLAQARTQLQVLHGLVWAPLADALTDARRVLLMPCAGLAGLPFAALQDGLTCLAQRHLLAEVPNLSLALKGLRSPAPPAPTAPMAGGLHDPGVVLLGWGDGGLRGASPAAQPVGHSPDPAPAPTAARQAARVQALLAGGGGARVLVRRWPVHDAVTTAFLHRFQQERRLGRGPTEALSEAQAGLMVNRPHPACWAGFVLCGGW